MSPEAQLRAIAAALGWTDLWMAPVGDLRAEPRLLGRPKPSDSYWPAPDYTKDLNTCAEFEGALRDNFTTQDFETARYIQHLENLVSNRARDRGWSFALVTATAAQKCEAFLKAKYLWRDTSL